MQEIKGTLIPIGGNEYKGEDIEDEGIEFIEEGILAHVVRESGGNKAKIVVIPTASSIPDIVGENYLDAFRKLSCEDVTILNLTNKAQCEDSKALQLLQHADCVMFSGGNQSRISKIIGNTTFHRELVNRYRNDDFVVAGTSAGAMAMAKEMIAGGSSKEAMLKGAVQMKKGLNLIPELIIDTHFIRRGRFGRLAEAVAIHPKLIGVGLAEDTGLIITKGSEAKVIGSGMVIVFDASEVTHNAHSLLKQGTPMSLAGLKTHILANGDRFTLEDRKTKVLPIKEAFV